MVVRVASQPEEDIAGDLVRDAEIQHVRVELDGLRGVFCVERHVPQLGGLGGVGDLRSDEFVHPGADLEPVALRVAEADPVGAARLIPLGAPPPRTRAPASLRIRAASSTAERSGTAKAT